MKKYILLIFLPLFLFSCKNKDCEGIDCTSPPPSFIFNLVDKTTGENLFTNQTLDSNHITILDENSISINYRFIDRDNLNLIDISEIGWFSGLKNYTIAIGSDVTFDIKVQVEPKSENCCSFFEMLQFEITEYQYEKPLSADFYTVKIDLK